MGTDNMTLGPGILYDGNGKPIGTGIIDGEQDTIPEIYNDDDSPAFTLRKTTRWKCMGLRRRRPMAVNCAGCLFADEICDMGVTFPVCTRDIDDFIEAVNARKDTELCPLYITKKKIIQLQDNGWL